MCFNTCKSPLFHSFDAQKTSNVMKDSFIRSLRSLKERKYLTTCSSNHPPVGTREANDDRLPSPFNTTQVFGLVSHHQKSRLSIPFSFNFSFPCAHPMNPNQFFVVAHSTQQAKMVGRPPPPQWHVPRRRFRTSSAQSAHYILQSIALVVNFERCTDHISSFTARDFFSS